MPQRPPNINGIVMPINFNFLDFQPMVVQMIACRFCLHIEQQTVRYIHRLTCTLFKGLVEV